MLAMASTQTGAGKLSAKQQTGALNVVARLWECKFSFVDDFVKLYREIYGFLPEKSEYMKYDMSTNDIAKLLVTR